MQDLLKTPVEKVMTKKVISIAKDEPVKEVFQLMKKHDILGLPVVDSKNHVIGIVTEGDLTRHFTTLRLPRSLHLLGSLVYLDDVQEFNQHLREHCAETVEGLMNTAVITIKNNQSFLEAINLMAEKKINRLPVVNASQELCGILTRTDVVHQLAQLNLI